ncbi:AAA family ATPase [Saccharothrix luteola]|uniref:AAA family ATPase n=1 Tax=Saccharothrix luteola TaxID=2893018 RepID=UPI001E4B7FB0|nr:ATP-binding protein [Saccharothrix luteola]MCC8248527.1 ATP-binding protein [Saccharothrix luteola]
MGNHRSFRDEQELLLMPVYAKDREVLPVAAVYGADASGKSNLLDGLKFMADAVRESFAQWRPGGGVPRRPFKLDPAARERPSVFVAEFVEAGVRYTYGFEVDDERVLSEWLYSYPEKRKRVLFDRSGGDVAFGKTVAEAGAKGEVLRELLRPNALFLSLAAQSNVTALLSPCRWFTERLCFRSGDATSDQTTKVAEFLHENPDMHERLVELVQAADFGIVDITVNRPPGLDMTPAQFLAIAEKMEELPRSGKAELRSDPTALADLMSRVEASLTRLARHRIRLEHGAGELFELDEESAGTRSWLGLLPDVLRILRDGGVLTVDEIDESLHSLLTARLIALFNDPQANSGNGQLLFTTHDATLLHPPLADEVLDRDEVWFVEKGETGASTLYPLSDFKPRREDNLERRYLAGQYGAVPRLYEEHFVNAVRDGVADDQA